MAHRLRAHDIELKLSNLILLDLEMNIYAASEKFCIIKEVSTRAGVRIIEELNKKVVELRPAEG